MAEEGKRMRRESEVASGNNPVSFPTPNPALFSRTNPDTVCGQRPFPRKPMTLAYKAVKKIKGYLFDTVNSF
jgi:hypothetical protein